MSVPKEKISILVSYLSDIQNKSIALDDLVSDYSHADDARILLNMNELFTFYHSSRIFYFSNEELSHPEIEDFFNAFEAFYFELKQFFVSEGKNLDVLQETLTLMQDSFESVTDKLALL